MYSNHPHLGQIAAANLVACSNSPPAIVSWAGFIPIRPVVFVLGLLGLHHMGRGLAGHEFGAAALGEAA